jgi:adenine-specific DNA-methyltransferase
MEIITSLTSTDIVSQNLETLKQLFPTIVKEGKIDVIELKALLGEEIEENEEYYRFSWAGKSQARLEANKPSTATLRPNKADSKNWDTTENIFIEGDNLEVLKLLQKSYANKIKMIYIDPPYNTGKDFVYKDNYADNLGNYLTITGQTDEEGKKLSTNTESDGRYHSNWLNMMYPRLKLARNLLTDDGVIFISLDDNEIHNLRKLCDEIFGEENFVASIIWKHTQQSKNDERYFSRQYNYQIVYRKSDELENIALPRTDEDNKNYSNPDNDSNGLWRAGDVRSPNYRKTLCFNIITPSGKIILPPENGWRWSEESIKEKIKSGEIIFSNDETRIVRKIYLNNQEGRTAENIWADEESGTTRQANTELKILFQNNVLFDTPKPTKLIEKILKLFYNKKEFIVLDFFAGSGTTAHAVMQLNAEDGGSRKCISVQLPEPTNEKSEAFREKYKTIAEITKERIRRAGEKIKKEVTDDLFTKEGKKLDIGFKAFTLDSSNIRAWDGNPDNLEANLFNTLSNIKENRTEEDILFEILLKFGLDLTVPIDEKVMEGKKVFNVGSGTLFICLSEEITPKTAEGIGAWKQELEPAVCRVIFKDSGFANDTDKTNAMQILKRFGIEEVNSI